MRRRELIKFGAAAFIAFPSVVRAQQRSTIPRIGFLFSGAPGQSPEIEAFRRGLAELGYREGQNIGIEYRFASGRIEQLPQLAAELVALQPAVIVTASTPPSWP
jgi:putative tryptophan/tyrosine transport system substrate-binding protein